MRVLRLTILFAISIPVRGQSPVFEAASIKLSTSGRPGSGLNLQPARIRIINSTLKFCVQMAWDVKDFQVATAAGWMESDRYDIEAVAAEPFKHEEYRTMLQALLADRFGLVIHRETREKTGYTLVVAKNGPKLPPAIEDQSVMFSRTPSGDRTLEATSVSMTRFADALSFPLGAIVVDQTGIEGQYNVSFQWTTDPQSDQRTSKSGEPAPPSDTMAGPSIFTALQEKLGLRLESRRVPVDVIVIERANRPTDN